MSFRAVRITDSEYLLEADDYTHPGGGLSDSPVVVYWGRAQVLDSGKVRLTLMGISARSPHDGAGSGLSSVYVPRTRAVLDQARRALGAALLEAVLEPGIVWGCGGAKGVESVAKAYHRQWVRGEKVLDEEAGDE